MIRLTRARKSRGGRTNAATPIELNFSLFAGVTHAHDFVINRPFKQVGEFGGGLYDSPSFIRSQVSDTQRTMLQFDRERVFSLTQLRYQNKKHGIVFDIPQEDIPKGRGRIVDERCALLGNG